MNRDLKESLIILKTDIVTKRSIFISIIGVLAVLFVLYGPFESEYGAITALSIVAVIYIIILAIAIRSAKYTTFDMERRHMSFLISSGIRRKNMLNGKMIGILLVMLMIIIIAPFYPLSDLDALTKFFLGLAISIGFSLIGLIVCYETFTITDQNSYKVTTAGTIILFMVIYSICAIIVAISKQYILCSIIIIAVCTAINWYVYKRALRAIDVMDA